MKPRTAGERKAGKRHGPGGRDRRARGQRLRTLLQHDLADVRAVAVGGEAGEEDAATDRGALVAAPIPLRGERAGRGVLLDQGAHDAALQVVDLERDMRALRERELEAREAGRIRGREAQFARLRRGRRRAGFQRAVAGARRTRAVESEDLAKAVRAVSLLF